MHTNRSIGSLASPLLRGPLFDPEAGSGTDSGSVDQDVVAKLVDNAGSGAGNTVKRPADMSNAEFEKLKSLASDLFDDDPDIGSAALKKMASMVGKGDWLQRTVEARQAPVEEEEVGEPVEEGGEADGGEDGGDEEGVVLHDGDEGGGEFAGHDDVLEEGFQDGLVLGHDAEVAAEEA